jgi:hypothetical protein
MVHPVSDREGEPMTPVSTGTPLTHSLTHIHSLNQSINQSISGKVRPPVVSEAYLRRNYRIGARDYVALWNKQNGKCPLCKSQPCTGTRLVVDHDHTTGLVRGLLCARCNLRLGTVEALLLCDDLTRGWVEGAVQYLKLPEASLTKALVEPILESYGKITQDTADRMREIKHLTRRMRRIYHLTYKDVVKKPKVLPQKQRISILRTPPLPGGSGP